MEKNIGVVVAHSAKIRFDAKEIYKSIASEHGGVDVIKENSIRTACRCVDGTHITVIPLDDIRGYWFDEIWI